MNFESTNSGCGHCNSEDHSSDTKCKNNEHHGVFDYVLPTATSVKTVTNGTEHDDKKLSLNDNISDFQYLQVQHNELKASCSDVFARSHASVLKHKLPKPVSARTSGKLDNASESYEKPMRSLEPSALAAAVGSGGSRPSEKNMTRIVDNAAMAAQSSADAPTASTSAQLPNAFPLALECDRAVVALSVHLVLLYKRVKSAFCRQRRLEGPGIKYNNGYDDKDGHYLVLLGEEILSRYTVQETLGKGSFGTVIRCYDEKRRENVALKITRQGLSFRTQAKQELDILLKLNDNQHLNRLVVKLLKVFAWQGHIVLVFELLSFNLYQLIRCTHYKGVTLHLVRSFARQLTHVLYQLELAQPSPIVHCDLKLENILLQNQNQSSIRLIDFGSSCYSNKTTHKYIQSRYYRSPEVILNLGYGTAVDRWSLACVLVELHTGHPLFDGRTEAAQLARFEAMLGPIPMDLLKKSQKALKFYEWTGTGFRLKEPSRPVRSLESVLGVTTGGPRGARKGEVGHDEDAYRLFHDFVTKLLVYSPDERMSCHDALKHPFLDLSLTGDHLSKQKRVKNGQRDEEKQEQSQSSQQQ